MFTTKAAKAPVTVISIESSPAPEAQETPVTQEEGPSTSVAVTLDDHTRDVELALNEGESK